MMSEKSATDTAAVLIQPAALAIRLPASAATTETAKNAPSRESLPAKAAATVPEGKILATLSPATNELEAAAATTTSAPRRKQLPAEAATVIRPMISTMWLPATAVRDIAKSERRGGSGRPEDDGDGDDDCPEGGSDDGAPDNSDRRDGDSGDEHDVGGGFGRDVGNLLLAVNCLPGDDNAASAD